MRLKNEFINFTNKLIDLEKKPNYLKDYINITCNFIDYQDKYIETLESELYELCTYHISYAKKFERVLLFTVVMSFISDDLNLFNYIESFSRNSDIIPFKNSFMNFVISNSGNLKRKLTYNEICELSMMYEMAGLFNIKFNDLKSLYKSFNELMIKYNINYD